MNSQPTFLFLTYFNAMDYDHIYQKDVHEITLNRVKLSLFPILSILNLSLNETLLTTCSIWDKPGWLNWFWQFLCESLSSFNPKRFYYSYAWSLSLCEGRTFFCMGLISTKLCRFLLMFSIRFYLTAIWLPHGQLWAIIEETASFTMLITAFYIFDSRVTGEPLKRGWAPKPSRAPSGVWAGNLPILIATP